MDAVDLLPIVAILSIVGVEYGGWVLLSFVTTRERLGAFRERFFRAGHAHAGVLLVLSLAYFLYLPRTDFSSALQWIAGIVLLLGVVAQSGGFFVHMAFGEEGQGSVGTRLTRTGALLIGAALVTLAVGLAGSL